MLLQVSLHFAWKTPQTLQYTPKYKFQNKFFVANIVCYNVKISYLGHEIIKPIYQYIDEQIWSLHFPSRLWLDSIIDIKNDIKSIKVSLDFSSPIKKFYSVDNRWFKDIQSLLQILNMVIWQNLTISILCLALSVLVQWPNFMCVITVSIIVS